MLKNILRKIIFVRNKGSVLINNQRIRVHPELLSFFNVLKNNPSEPALHKFLDKWLNVGDVFIDVGANAGFMSMLASKKVGANGKVISIEPNPYVAEYTHYTLANNGLKKNWIFLQLAISENTSVLSFSLGADSSPLMETASFVYGEGKAEKVEVLGTTLDAIVPWTIENKVVLKIDVEGAEVAVLQGARELIKNKRPVIVLEIHGLYFQNPRQHVKKVFDFISQHNYYAVNIQTARVESIDDFMNSSEKGGRTGYGNVVLLPSMDLLDQCLQRL